MVAKKMALFAAVVSYFACHSFYYNRVLDAYSESFYEYHAKHEQTTEEDKTTIFIDMISIASNKRPEYFQTQRNTFGSHPSVRNFHVITESHDTEADCMTHMNNETLKTITDFHCRPEGRRQLGINESNQHLLLLLASMFITSERLFQLYGNNAYGWMCAQKRPIDGLYKVLSQYKLQDSYDRKGLHSIPDYLLIMDDDTWFNMDMLLPTLTTKLARNVPGIASGCLIIPRKFPADEMFHFSWGGFGTVLSKSAIEKLIRPLHCNEDHDVCQAINQDRIGERHLFQEGMSIADLMYKYTFDQAFKDAARWNEVGYCFHSDVTISYFLQYATNNTWNEEIFDHARSVGGAQPKCKVEKTCSIQDKVCHYIKPKQMESFHATMDNFSSMVLLPV